MTKPSKTEEVRGAEAGLELKGGADRDSLGPRRRISEHDRTSEKRASNIGEPKKGGLRGGGGRNKNL